MWNDYKKSRSNSCYLRLHFCPCIPLALRKWCWGLDALNGILSQERESSATYFVESEQKQESTAADRPIYGLLSKKRRNSVYPKVFSSETSSAASSNGSSEHGPHYDTLPLNPVKKSVSRTKSMDYGIRRGFGSFRNNAFGKLGNKHGSCNV